MEIAIRAPLVLDVHVNRKRVDDCSEGGGGNLKADHAPDIGPLSPIASHKPPRCAATNAGADAAS
jgi:hypothetical protein